MTKISHPRMSAMSHCSLGYLLTLALILMPVLFSARPLHAQVLSTLHEFTGPDGQEPEGDLVVDTAGNLYGTTPAGGAGDGVIFKITPAGVYSTPVIFGGSDGSGPSAGLLHAGSFYGTTYSGGASNLGVVFKWTGKVLTVLHSFSGSDGEHPAGALIRDSAGNLYGTTFYGGADSGGTIFKIDATGVESVLYSFTGGADGKFPAGHLVRDTAGNLYGTASEGGIINCANGTRGCGTVFKLDATGNFSVLYTFNGGTDGGEPLAGLVRDSKGNLYGTTSSAGINLAHTNCSANNGCGTIFKLSKTGQFTLVYGFTGGTDGYRPVADLVRDKLGNLYGTTQYSGGGYGVVFEVSSAGVYSALYNFTDGTDGGDPVAGLVLDSAGNIYGTGSIGGNPDFEEGVVFKIIP